MNTYTVPPGYNTVNGFIVVKGAADLIEFLTQVFDGVDNEEAKAPDFYAADGTLIHAEVKIGNSVVMVADRKENWPFTPALTQVYVGDARETLGRAIDHGAEVVTEVSPFYGGFDIARFLDPWGNLWWLFAPGAGTEVPADSSDWDNPKPDHVYTSLLDTMQRLKDPS